MGFIDMMRAQGYAVESVVAVLREQGVAIAARTYRAWRKGLLQGWLTLHLWDEVPLEGCRCA